MAEEWKQQGWEAEQAPPEAQEGQSEPQTDPGPDMGEQPPSWVQYGPKEGQTQQAPPREEMRAPTHGPGGTWIPPWRRPAMAMNAPIPSSSAIEAACRALEEKYSGQPGWALVTTIVAATAHVALDLAGKLWGGSDQPDQATQ